MVDAIPAVADTITLTYAIGTIGMLVGVIFAVRLLGEDGTDGRFGYLLIIPGFAALAYAIMTIGIGSVTLQGYSVPIPRYVDWLVTTPVLVGYAAYVSGMDRKWVVGVALADAAMIILGGVAVSVEAPARWAGFAASSGFHLSLLWAIYRVFPERAAQQNSKRRRLASVLRNHVGLLWIAYPLVWLVGPGLQVVSATAIAMIITYLDVVAKVPYVYFVYRARGGFGAVETTSRDQGTPSQGVPSGD
jgi:sensory rhodopsin